MLAYLKTLWRRLTGDEWVDRKMAAMEAFKQTPEYETWKTRVTKK